MFVSIRRYSPKNGSLNRASIEVLRRQFQQEFLPIVRQIAGFHGCYVINVENRELITLSLSETAESAAEAARCMLEYTRRNPLVFELGRPDVTEGEVLTLAEGLAPSGQAETAAAAALALWYEESRSMLLTASNG